MNSKVMQVNVGETGTYAPIVAEGAEIPADEQDYSAVTFTAVKRAVRPLITQELVDDSMFPVISWEIAKAGARLENSLKRAMVDEILTTNAATASLCTDFGNAGATPLTHLDEAITTVKNNGYIPNRVLFHPSCFSAYRIALQGLYYDTGVTSNQGLPKVFGLDAYETGVTDDNSSYTWGWGTDNYLGG
jgi:hypothetical protein